MLEFKFSSSSLSQENADDVLILMFIRLFKEISPFKMFEEYPNIQVLECAHLLDFLYDMIVPKLEKQDDIIEVEIQQEVDQQEGDEKSSTNDSIHVKQFFNFLWELLSKLIKGIKLLKKPIEHVFNSQEKDEEEKPKDENSSTLMNKTPLVEEIAIPSVEQLVISGPLVMARYTELMNGIIDSENDAKILREKGIILNHLKSDKEVANMWNGMSKSLRLSR
ncbi:UPF0481 protein, partial [Trifolium medium]|nr:UPF0481 protein [Trifolium medium]